MTPLVNRYDIVFLFDVTNGNPNGDPDAGNLPRMDPETSVGLITDVSLKRKIRNYTEIARGDEPGYRIYVQEGSILNEKHREAYKAVRKSTDKVDKEKSLNPKNDEEAGQLTKFMCDNFFDVRAFGAVMSTAINAGQVRGPVQVAFARSVEPILPLEISITRMAATNEKEKADREKGIEGDERTENRTMGRKHVVPYGLYRAHIFVNAKLAERTGLFQVGRFIFPAASAFIKGSGLDLQADSIDRLLTSAAELDETPGMVRPITLNVVGYVLASGKAIAPSLEAGVLIRRYIERTVEQPGIRDCAPQLLERMITEQGTKRPRSEQQLVADTKLRRAEVRAVLNALDEAGLARTLDKERAEWELSHDFVAHAVGRFLGRRRSQMLRQTGAYAAPALLAISLAGGLWMGRFALNDLIYMYVTVRPYVLTAEGEGARIVSKEPFRECAADCPEMIVVTAGEFMMGSPDTEKDREKDEGPQRKVTIAKPFAVARFNVTFAEWDACADHGGCEPRVGDQGWGRGRRPVINVSWDDARRYVEWLSRLTGRSYRLLTESEWEYAARAGTKTAYYWGDDIGKGNANCMGCSSEWERQTSPVGSFKPNAFSLYDMAGNVWQWVQDCYHVGYAGAPDDGSAWTEGDCNRRVLRGGSWGYSPQGLRSAIRFRNTAANRDSVIGFRVGRTLTP
jgi:CRISPR-associated protein Cas7/Csd2 subtype I-C